MFNLTSTVIICTRNRVADIVRCLESLLVQTVMPDQLIVVDSSDVPLHENSDFIKIFNADRFGNTALVYKHTAPGLTLQRNIGSDCATSDIVHFIDDDVVLTSHYLASMRALFEENPNCAGGMGTVTNIPVLPKRNWHRALRYIFLLQRDYASGNFTLSGMPTHAYGTTRIQSVEVLGGCCMAYRLWVVKQYRFDERLARYGFMEDCDFSRRVSYDFPLLYNPHAQLAHYPSPLNRDSVVDNRAMYMKNYRYLFYKNVYPRNRFAIIAFAWSIVGLFVEALLARDTGYLTGYWKGFWQPLERVNHQSVEQRTL